MEPQKVMKPIIHHGDIHWCSDSAEVEGCLHGVFVLFLNFILCKIYILSCLLNERKEDL